jgi:2-polyprenyl-6-methoxyphenol hydroxylase-like FAD-dependent oxidoreductase
MTFQHVVILGGGPVGLLCAIEAKRYFPYVTIIEKRSTYSRTNVPVVDPELRKHFKKLDVHEKMGFGESGQEGAAPFRQIEETLLKLARIRRVQIRRPFVVSSLSGGPKFKHGRYKEILMTIQEWDDKLKRPVIGGRGAGLVVDLLVVATGGGAAADPLITEKLGISYDKLKAKNYGAYGIFEEKGATTESASDARFQAKTRAYEIISSKSIAFNLADYNYLLANLAGITKADYKTLRLSQEKLKKLLTAIMSSKHINVIEEIKEIDKNVALFKIAIQRAKQFYSPIFPAVLVGDAAVTPHPEQGSGYTTGFLGFMELKVLFEALAKTTRSKDCNLIFQSFNDRYELHVSRKALAGTGAILANNHKMLSNFSSDLRNLLPEVTGEKYRKALLDDIAFGDELARQLKEQEQTAKKYLDYLKPDQGKELPNLDWDETAGALWRSVAETWKKLKELTEGFVLLDSRLKELETLLRVK